MVFYLRLAHGFQTGGMLKKEQHCVYMGTVAGRDAGGRMNHSMAWDGKTTRSS